MSYQAQLQKHLSSGWQMIAEGSSGAQLKKPKQLSRNTKQALVLGILLVFPSYFIGAALALWIAIYAVLLGLLFIGLALLDHAFRAKEETVFIPREVAEPRDPFERAAQARDAKAAARRIVRG